jgi:hypothetical protein
MKKINKLGIKKVTLRDLSENTLNEVAGACCPTVTGPTCVCPTARIPTCVGQKTCSTCT